MTREECIEKIRHIQKSMYTFIFEDGMSHKFKADDADKFYYYLDMIAKYLDEDVPNEQKPKTGHWEYEQDIRNFYCSKCKCGHQYISPSWKYCPNCGAKMVDPKESEDKE